MVDSSGKFWRWNFDDFLPPTLVFRLADRAPRDRLTCLTTDDGAWNAVVGTDQDQTQGIVHCYPSDNDEARIYNGVLAVFTQMQTEQGETITFVAVVNVTETELSFSMNQLGRLAKNTIQHVETTMPLDDVCGTPMAMVIDDASQVAVVLVSPDRSIVPNTSVFFALIFDMRTGIFLVKQELVRYEGDCWTLDDRGIFRERSGCIVQRLSVIPDALPVRGSPTDPTPRTAVSGFSGIGDRSGREGRMLPVMPPLGLELSPPRRGRSRGGSLPLLGSSPPGSSGFRPLH